MYKCSVVLPIKDEPISYLLEWIEWCLYIGVDHFYIYDDDSKYSLSETLEPYSEYISFHSGLFRGMEKRQRLFYEYCLDKYSSDSEWMAFIDCDEYIVLPMGEVLCEFLEAYTEYPAVMLFWKEFGTSGHKVPARGLVIENYVKFKPKGKTSVFPCKSIVQPKKFKQFVNVHYFEYKDSCLPVTVNKKIMDSHCLYPDKVNNVVQENYVLYHYVTKSKQDLEEKILRGSAMVGQMREKKIEKLYNLDKACTGVETEILEHCDSFKKFRSKKEIKNMRENSLKVADNHNL